MSFWHGLALFLLLGSLTRVPAHRQLAVRRDFRASCVANRYRTLNQWRLDPLYAGLPPTVAAGNGTRFLPRRVRDFGLGCRRLVRAREEGLRKSNVIGTEAHPLVEG